MPKNLTNLSALKLLAIHRLKPQNSSYHSRKIYHFPIQKNQFSARALILLPSSKKTDEFSVKQEVERRGLMLLWFTDLMNVTEEVRNMVDLQR